jgi:hypothetical protein
MRCTLTGLVDVPLILSVLILCSGCQRSPTPKPVGTDSPAFQKPTATEVFNLRSKCAELGEKLNGEYDLTGIGLATADDLPYPFQQEHFSHYDPTTNRCYVELRASPNLGVLTMLSTRNAKALKIRGDFLARYEVDYLERRLYDGQTGEELASLQKGVKGVTPTGVVKGRLSKVEWFDAANEIDALMADDRKQ